MILKKIELVNFRNYKKNTIKLGNNINIFIGNNGHGKTNILEAIYILAVTKSHRYGEQSFLIRKGCEVAKIKGTLKLDKLFKDLEIDIDKNDKKVFINNTNIKKISDYVTNFNVIMFNPDDLEVIKGSPQIRRNLLNIEISQMDLSYIKNLNEYNKILKTRNEYLKSMYINNMSDYRYLNVLTEKLIEKALIIYKYRYEFINMINDKITDIYKDITLIDNLKIKYENSINFSYYDEDIIKNDLYNKFNKNFQREMQQGSTLYGPHRDDFSFFIDNEDARIFASQGCQRLAVISFKLAEIDIFYNKTGYYPVLLLDDIFSEIDIKKKSRLIKYINQDVQVIITATDLKNINKKLLNNSKIFEVISGNIQEREK